MMKDKNIAVCSRTFYNNNVLRQKLNKISKNILFNKSKKTLDGKKLVNFIKNSEKIIVGLEKIDKIIIDQLPNLKIIIKYGVGMDKIDINYLKKKKIKLFHFPGFNKRSVSELTLCFILSISRNLIELNQSVKKNNWDIIIGNNLSGKKIGIIGAGFVGKDLISLLKPFHCKIYINDIKNIKNYCKKNKLVFSNKKYIFSNCDFVSLHIPFNKQNKNLINKEYLKLMKPNSSLINTSRGGIVNEKDLYRVLKTKSIKSAYFDVLENEPPKKNSKLLKLRNFFISPHIGGSTSESIIKGGTLCLKKLSKKK